MKLSTPITVETYEHPIDYASRILSIGSCFAENMGNKCDYFKFQNTVNPLGIIFNPVSIEKLVRRALENQPFEETDVFFHNDTWQCYEVHSELSHPDKETYLHTLNERLAVLQVELSKASHVFITYGTAWVYTFKGSGQVVANCHKVPQNQFDKALLSVQTIEASMQYTVDLIRKANPQAKIITTISPVRHSKDGFVENQRSKAHLITALHPVLQANTAGLNYFPSYEIMMDELRDYRFYAEDMLHPSALAIEYIWERFTTAYMTPSALATMQEVDTIQKGLAHRPFNPDSPSHQKFLQSLNQKIISLQEQIAGIRF
jgi:lysophospholipase L1-like esterase